MKYLERIRVGLSRTDDRFVVAASFVAGVVSGDDDDESSDGYFSSQ